MIRHLNLLGQWLIRKKISVFLWGWLSFFYFFFYALRVLFYRLGILKSYTLPVQVISVGNITWGGTGKTPLVLYLGNRLKGKKLVVLSRGYGRGKGQKIFPVSPRENKIGARAGESGDEPFLLASELPQATVVVGKKRRVSGRWAVDNIQPEVIILDDGFQHWGLKRNLEAVIIDATNPFGNGWLIPAGILREPLSALGRAHIIFISRVDEGASSLAEIKKRIRRHNNVAPIVECVIEPDEFFLWPGGKMEGVDFIRGKKVYALVSTGSPFSFRRTLIKLGAEPTGESIYPDHFSYTLKDSERVIKEAKKSRAELIVTTQKDFVRLPAASFAFPIGVLRVKLRITAGEEVLDAWLS